MSLAFPHDNLKINSNKTQCVLFHNHSKYNTKHFLLDMNGINLVKATKLLFIDENLKWHLLGGLSFQGAIENLLCY